jgi:hypothetical protein
VSATDPRADRARDYLGSHQQPVSTLPPSALMRQLEDTRHHLAAVLGILVTGLDSEPWTCRGCGAEMIGRRPAGDRCQDCGEVN